MVRHVVTLTARDDVTPEQLADVVSVIASLPHVVPGIRSYSVGTDLGIDDGNASIAIVADFDDQTSYEIYRDHPEHRRVINEHVRPILAGRAAAQIGA